VVTDAETAPDWSREHRPRGVWSPDRSLLKTIRDYQRHRARGGPISAIARRWAVLRHRFWSAVTGADIPINAPIGGGLMIPHPNGIVIHPASTIGPNCLILQQVTLARMINGSPTLGAHVDIGAGAKLLGGIHIGDHARVGANAVVMQDVPAGATAVGIPARIIPDKRPVPRP